MLFKSRSIKKLEEAVVKQNEMINVLQHQLADLVEVVEVMMDNQDMIVEKVVDDDEWDEEEEECILGIIDEDEEDDE